MHQPSRLVFLPSLPTPAPGPNKMSPCVTCQPASASILGYFTFTFFCSSYRILCLCSAPSDRNIFIVAKISDSARVQMFVSTFKFLRCYYHSCLPRRREKEMSPVACCPVSISAGALLLVDARSSGSGRGPERVFSWCILKFGRGNLSNLTCQEVFFFPFKARSSLRAGSGPFKASSRGGDHVSWPHPLCLPRPSQTRIHSGIVAGGGVKNQNDVSPQARSHLSCSYHHIDDTRS
jgi:hypothetical protein